MSTCVLACRDRLVLSPYVFRCKCLSWQAATNVALFVQAQDAELSSLCVLYGPFCLPTALKPVATAFMPT